MKLAGTSDTGWVPMDLAEVAAAIALVRASAVAARVREARTAQRKQSAVPSR